MINQQDEQLRREIERLQARYDFLLAAVDNLPNPIFMKDEEAKFFFFNKAYSEFFNMKRSEYLGKTVLDLDYLPHEDRERFQNEDLKAIRELDIISYDTEFAAPDGENHPAFYWSRGFEDKLNDKHGLVGEIVDLYKERTMQDSLDDSISNLEKVNEMLNAQSEEPDGSETTGIYSRSVLWGKGRELIESATSSSSKTHVAMFDLDNFQRINDQHGHMKGDQILSQFAAILRLECRSTDLPVRYGGDEFMVVLNNTNANDAVKIAERIRAHCERDLLLSEGDPVTVSAAVTDIRESESLDDSIERLQDYIQEAKSKGRNCVISHM